MGNLSTAAAPSQPVANDEHVALPPVAPPVQVVQDYGSVGMSLRAHPVSFLRPMLDDMRVTRNAELPDEAKWPHGAPVCAAGLVLIRQRPGTASGIVFFTIEDETGVANLIVRPRVFERCRKAARHSQIILAQGRVERQGQVVHVMVTDIREAPSTLPTYCVRHRATSTEADRGRARMHRPTRVPRTIPLVRANTAHQPHDREDAVVARGRRRQPSQPVARICLPHTPRAILRHTDTFADLTAPPRHRMPPADTPPTPNATPPDGAPRRRTGIATKLALIVMGLGIGLLLGELLLMAIDQPRFYSAHSAPPQFTFLNERDGDAPVYVNLMGKAIRFEYDGNPRGYFDADNAVTHTVNGNGFRGDEFSTDKPNGVTRIAFLGDSFTFGEGVRDDDIYTEQVERLLNASGADTEYQSYNFGVGGYNTSQAVYALKTWAIQTQPDIVVLGYVLNDAEPKLFVGDAAAGQIRRRPRGDVPEGADEPRPPDTALYRSRISQLIWRMRTATDRTSEMVDWYASLYDDDNPGWHASRAALVELIAFCNERDIPCIVACFPIFIQLDNYPLSNVHAKVGDVVREAGSTFVDLLPTFENRDAASLWVHPTDQHPNEIAHLAAAEVIARAIADTHTTPTPRDEPEAQP